MKKLLLVYLFSLLLHLSNAQKIDPAVIHLMEASVENGTYPNIHSILIAYKNKLIYEKYWSGEDRKESKNLGVIKHGPGSLHASQSMSKSITSACVGIALLQGKIKSIDEKIFDFFPEYAAPRPTVLPHPERSPELPICVRKITASYKYFPMVNV